MIRNLLLLAAWVCAFAGAINTARADTFTATYRELAPSPQNVIMTWYSGAVTKDGKFVYGIGNSHNAYGDNSMWLYDPATDKHTNLAPSTGNKWAWTAGVEKSGHWSDPSIRALTNRNNHQAFYVAARDEFWVLAGTTFYQSSPYFAGRFSLATKRWEYLSPPWAEKTRSDLADFADGVVANMGSWTAPNAVTATCTSTNTVVLFGGMSDSTGTVRIIEPNTAGPEPYRMATSPKPPFHFPAENARHNAACVGDTVYFVEGDRRVPGTGVVSPPVAQFWKFHVPTRAWTRLPDGPPGGYFGLLTADTTAQALVLYGGSASNKLWVYDLIGGQWHNLTGKVPNLPRADMHTGGFIPGFGHLYKGGKRYSLSTGASEGYGASRKLMVISLKREGGSVEPPPVDEPPPVEEPPVEEPPPPVEEPPPPVDEPPPPTAPPTEVDASVTAIRAELDKAKAAINAADSLLINLQTPVGEEPPATDPPATEPPTGTTPPAEEPPPAEQPPSEPAALNFEWKKLPLPGWPASPQGSMKHQRLAEGPNGRVYLIGGDFGGGEDNIGRQSVHSFSPDLGDWRMETPECGTKEHPTHWHTDEKGVAWDAKRKVFQVLAGTVYGPGDACLAAGGSVKAKVMTYDPATKLWTKPAHVVQANFGYVTNGILDPDKDEMVQIIDTAAKHLNLETGQWATYPLAGSVKKFNVLPARIGRTVYWQDRAENFQAYDLDTHKVTNLPRWPFGVIDSGYAVPMMMAHGDKVLALWPNNLSTEPKRAALYDPATKTWAKVDVGEGRGNTAMMHSSGRLILMGGMAPPEDHNKFVWVGTVR